jgi:hypothetical protein
VALQHIGYGTCGLRLCLFWACAGGSFVQRFAEIAIAIDREWRLKIQNVNMLQY